MNQRDSTPLHKYSFTSIVLCLFTYKTYAIKDGFSDMNFCIRVNQRQLNLPKTYEKVSSYMLLNQNFLTENSEL